MPKPRARAAGIADVTDIFEKSELVEGTGLQDAAKEAISRRAYQLWVERGCPEGSPEADWFKAESEFGDRPESQ